MSSSSFPLPTPLLDEVKRIASDRKISWEQWLLVAIQERVQAEQSFQVLRSYGDRLDLEAFDAVMAKVPDVEPIPILGGVANEGDEL
jgi:hypothetical protein